ncbi:UBX domain-containing protein 11 [Histomonas meleagridis]|uniref:UBX domain-containing protein 11 n=1 Tax=Histomonas meleagridis TaxID=135588 RepID=UPI00355A7D12|nr:UBX domain-containing protein 11 [Histomonas meleagridis]KAH0798789.1 UBX domain-containing protein 11 [Histomonas meleagridis]
MGEEINYKKQIAHLERIAEEKLAEIKRLEQVLQEEQEKGEKHKQEIQEITDFLADYDLQWVGGPGPKNLAFPRGPTDMNLFMQKIHDLNDLVESELDFKNESGVTKVGHKKPIKITLLDDGFTLNNGELRPYNIPHSSDFFQDIYDGFFPLEFKKDYPDGVRLTVEDLRKNDLFKGKPKTYGDE